MGVGPELGRPISPAVGGEEGDGADKDEKTLGEGGVKNSATGQKR